MIKEIVKDVMFLSLKSEIATKEDLYVAEDLLDTIKANSDRCVGMAANMIGVRKRIIVVNTEKDYLIMINPVIIDHTSQEYQAEEGCLSLVGVRKVNRYPAIVVEYYDIKFKKQKKTFKNETAQIIQHEIDHFEGRLI